MVSCGLDFDHFNHISTSKFVREVVDVDQGGVVKVSAYEAMGPGFEPRSRHDKFRDCVSPASKSSMNEVSFSDENSRNKPTQQEFDQKRLLSMVYMTCSPA